MGESSKPALSGDSSGIIDEDEPLDVLDLPQLYQRPTAETLLSTLTDLSSAPLSWDTTTPTRSGRQINPEGIPAYLTQIIASSLSWIENEEAKEQIRDAASQRLSERSGRTGMGDITRTFRIPVNHPEGADEMLEITLHEPALTADNLGLKTWAASYLLAKRLPLLARTLPKPTRILELGSGTGLVGLAAAEIFDGVPVLLTDLPDITPNLLRNATANASAAEVGVLDWSDPTTFVSPPGSFDLVFAADPIYESTHPELLVGAIGHHLSRDNKDARVVIELPLREAYVPEHKDLRERMKRLVHLPIYGQEGISKYVNTT